mgnify:CR=1 FL=1
MLKLRLTTVSLRNRLTIPRARVEFSLWEYLRGDEGWLRSVTLRQPTIEVDPQTYQVRANGELLTCDPADVLPMAQRYFLF